MCAFVIIHDCRWLFVYAQYTNTHPYVWICKFAPSPALQMCHYLGGPNSSSELRHRHAWLSNANHMKLFFRSLRLIQHCHLEICWDSTLLKKRLSDWNHKSMGAFQWKSFTSIFLVSPIVGQQKTPLRSKKTLRLVIQSMPVTLIRIWLLSWIMSNYNLIQLGGQASSPPSWPSEDIAPSTPKDTVTSLQRFRRTWPENGSVSDSVSWGATHGERGNLGSTPEKMVIPGNADSLPGTVSTWLREPPWPKETQKVLGNHHSVGIKSKGIWNGSKFCVFCFFPWVNPCDSHVLERIFTCPMYLAPFLWGSPFPRSPSASIERQTPEPKPWSGNWTWRPSLVGCKTYLENIWRIYMGNRWGFAMIWATKENTNIQNP